MQITPDQLLAEAGQLALEVRLKDRRIAALEQQIAELASRLADRPAADGDQVA